MTPKLTKCMLVMKKPSLIYLLVLLGLLMSGTGCTKKNNSSYTCTCVYLGSYSGTDTTVKIVFKSGTTQTQAAANCASDQSSYRYIDTAAKCSL